jgi:hypothetical protein
MAHHISTDLRNHIVFTSIAGTDCVFFFDGIEISEAEYWTLSAVAQAQTAANGAALIATETGTFADLFA